MPVFLKIVSVLLILAFTFSCRSRKLHQDSMFTNRSHKTKKKGVYDAGLHKKKPISVQIKQEYDAMTKYDTKPEKAKKKAVKELQKRKAKANKARAKNNKKRRTKVKLDKEKSSGDK